MCCKKLSLSLETQISRGKKEREREGGGGGREEGKGGRDQSPPMTWSVPRFGGNGGGDNN